MAQLSTNEAIMAQLPIWQVPGPSEMKIIILFFPSYYFALINGAIMVVLGTSPECVPTLKVQQPYYQKAKQPKLPLSLSGAVVECSTGNSQRQFQLDPSIYFSGSRPPPLKLSFYRCVRAAVASPFLLVHVLFSLFETLATLQFVAIFSVFFIHHQERLK